MRPRLACALALVVWTAVAAPAAAEYSRVAEVQPDDDIGIAGDVVVVGSTPEGGSSVLAAYAQDGTARPIELLDPGRFVEELTTSRSALATLTIPAEGGGLHGYYGPVAGPLRRLPRGVVDVATTGPRVVSLVGGHGRRAWLEVRNVRTGTARRIALPGSRVGVVSAAGRYAAYLGRLATPRETAIVVDLATGREVYRAGVAEFSTYGLAPDGRLWFLHRSRRSGRVLTATPKRPQPRAVARLPMAPYEFAVSRDGIAVVRDLGDGAGRILLLRANGKRRAVTPALPAINAVAWDGPTLAFNSGRCVFAGPVPDTAPDSLALDGCESQWRLGR